MTLLDELHEVDAGVLPRTRVIAGGKATAKGGHFAPGTRGPRPKRVRGESFDSYMVKLNEWRSRELVPEIRVNDRGDGTQLMSFLHEFGHRIDYIGSSSRSVTGGVSGFYTERTTGAVQAFIEAARATPTISEAMRRFGDAGFVRYYRSPIEVWARAYSQWASNKLGGKHRLSLEAQFAKTGPNQFYQWPDDEFDTLAPLVEAVLRERGLLQ